jgi:hypothetical protein
MINVNMDKARDIHRNNVRQARNPKLAEKDIEFQRALETGSDTSAIVADKQSLRDAPADPDIDAATTPEELKAAWKSDLLGDSPYVS